MASGAISAQGQGKLEVEPNIIQDDTNDTNINLLSDTSHLTPDDNALFTQIKQARKTDKQLSYCNTRLRAYYERQNDVIDGYEQMNHITALYHSSDHTRLRRHLQHADTVADEKNSKVRFVLNMSFYLTFVIISLKAYTAARSTSIAVISICVDSGLDLISQGILLYSNKLIKRVDLYRYPSGRSKIEPVAIVVFSCIMGTAAIILLIESVQKLAEDLTSTPSLVNIDAVVIALIGVVVVIQLSEYIYCRIIASQTDESSSVIAIADDHINDVCINIVGGVPAIIAGLYPSVFWLDPLGGILLACYIAVRWTRTCVEQLPQLLGRSADPQTLSKLTYLAMTHSDQIIHVDTVLAYYSGPKLQVEIHIVLPGELTLQRAHDIGESLECTVESVEGVEMAFVHLDFESDHRPEHGRGKAPAHRDDKSVELQEVAVV